MAIGDDTGVSLEDAGAVERPARVRARRTTAAALVGSVLESYDFTIYGLGAALVIGPLFFPGESPGAQVVAALLTFAIGYFARPVGGLVFAHLGDRVGRKPMLIGTLLLMGVGTVGIGVLPTFETVGVLAPILLTVCRFLQGLGVGAEYVGALAMMGETGGEKRFGLRVALPGMGIFIGVVLATGVFQLIAALPDEALFSWGWRIPFLFALVSIVAGLIIRRGAPETDEFRAVQASGQTVRIPLVHVVRTQWRDLLVGVGINAPYLLFSSVLQVFVLSYLTNTLGIDRSIGLLANLLASVVAIGTVPLFGHLADRFGALRVWIAGLIAMAVFAGVAFPVFASRSPAAIVVVVIIGIGVALAALYATQGNMLIAMFSSRHRVTGVVVVRESTAALVSGPAPAIVASLVAAAGSTWPATVVLLGGVVVAALVALIVRRRTRAR